jgi:hypothetical protein
MVRFVNIKGDVQIVVLGVMKTYGLTGGYKRFGGTYYLHLHLQDYIHRVNNPEDYALNSHRHENFKTLIGKHGTLCHYVRPCMQSHTRNCRAVKRVSNV